MGHAMMKFAGDLVGQWRAEAALFRRRGLEESARQAESYAAELEARVREWQMEALPLDQAATESGYSYSHLQQRIAEGSLPNAGEKGSPRIRRSDLPVKGGAVRRSIDGKELDIAGEIIARRSGTR